MKNYLLLLLLLPFIGISQDFNSQELDYGSEKKYTNSPQWVKLMYSEQSTPDEVTKKYSEYYKSHTFVKNTDTQFYKRWLRSFSRGDARFMNSNTRNTQLKKIDKKYILQSKKLKHSKSPTSQWQGIGPIDFDKESVSKSYAAGAGHVYTTEQSLTNDSILFAGTATAGVWKSNNKGQTWELMTSEMLVNGVLAIEIDPFNENVVYFGSSKKIYKTIDGGINWIPIGDVLFNTEEHRIPEIRIHPTNSNLLFVCSNKGFFRSTDGGMNFTEILDGEFQEMEFNPIDPNMCYIIKKVNDQTEFYKSIDGGLTFTIKTIGWPVPGVNEEQKRTEIATTPAAPHKVFALSTGVANGGSGLYGMYISNDFGETWVRTCCGPQPGGIPSFSNQNLMGWSDQGIDDGGQYYYDLALEVSDNDSNKVFVGAVNLWISDDGGNTFSCPSKWSHSYKHNYVHADIHDLKFFGNDFWLSSDGGTFYSTSEADTIDRRMTGIAGTDFWGFGTGFWDGEVMLGGTYHNGTLLKDNDVYLNGWVSTGGGDNIRGFVNPGDDNVVVYDYGEFQLSGDRMQSHSALNYNILPNASYTIGKSSNIEYHPQSHNTSFLGKNGTLWRTDDDGNYFDSVYYFGATDITSIEIADSDPSTIYLATFSGWWDTKNVWKLTNSGSTWVNITPSSAVLGGDDWIPYDITINSTDPNTIWLARTSMYNGYPDYDGKQILKSIDGGGTWLNYSTPTLNGEYITSIEHQRGTNDGIYIGTRKGVYYRNGAMNDWQLFNNNLPFSTITVQLSPYYRKGKIRTGTNRSVYECEFYENSHPEAQISIEYLGKHCPNSLINFYNRSVANESNVQWNWIFEGGTPATSTDRNPTVFYDNFGIYDVTLTVTDTFGTSTQFLDDFVYVENCLGWDTVIVDSNLFITKDKNYNLKIYPTITQSNSELRVENPLNQKLTYNLYSAEGRLIESNKVEGNRIRIGDLSKGAYFINLIGSRNMLNKTIIIE